MAWPLWEDNNSVMEKHTYMYKEVLLCWWRKNQLPWPLWEDKYSVAVLTYVGHLLGVGCSFNLCIHLVPYLPGCTAFSKASCRTSGFYFNPCWTDRYTNNQVFSHLFFSILFHCASVSQSQIPNFDCNGCLIFGAFSKMEKIAVSGKDCSFCKDRHYLDKEWGHYFSGAGRKTILEIGCGAGNTIFPLVATYPDIFVYACDFSQRAVNLVKAHKEFRDSHVSTFVCDLTVDDLKDHISPSSVDIVTMIFVLSAVSPEKMSLVLQNVRKVLKPGGYVLFRDYATGDLSQERLISKYQKISEIFYIRGDGTRAFYFSNEFLTSMLKDNGFDVEELGLCCKQVENRSRELVMNRRWVQAVFRISDGTDRSANTEVAVRPMIMRRTGMKDNEYTYKFINPISLFIKILQRQHGKRNPNLWP